MRPTPSRRALPHAIGHPLPRLMAEPVLSPVRCRQSPAYPPGDLPSSGRAHSTGHSAIEAVGAASLVEPRYRFLVLPEDSCTPTPRAGTLACSPSGSAAGTLWKQRLMLVESSVGWQG